MHFVHETPHRFCPLNFPCHQIASRSSYSDPRRSVFLASSSSHSSLYNNVHQDSPLQQWINPFFSRFFWKKFQHNCFLDVLSHLLYYSVKRTNFPQVRIPSHVHRKIAVFLSLGFGRCYARLLILKSLWNFGYGAGFVDGHLLIGKSSLFWYNLGYVEQFVTSEIESWKGYGTHYNQECTFHALAWHHRPMFSLIREVDEFHISAISSGVPSY